jgi:hypothetical protein
MSLLPYNSTKFERDVEQAIKYAADVSLLFGFKFENVDPQLRLALAWEYSLTQVNIDDFMERVLKGLEFHRLRGTPISLRNALSWYGFHNIIIEEEPFILSFTPLSSGKRTVRRIFIDEYFLREKGFHVVNDFEPGVQSGIRERERSVVFEWDLDVNSGAERNHFAAVEYKGADTWRDHKHFHISWNKCSEFTPILEATE